MEKSIKNSLTPNKLDGEKQIIIGNSLKTLPWENGVECPPKVPYLVPSKYTPSAGKMPGNLKGRFIIEKHKIMGNEQFRTGWH